MLIKERIYGETTHHIIYWDDYEQLTLRYKLSDGSSVYTRTLDQYETEMVLAAWDNGYEDGMSDGLKRCGL